MTPLAPSTLLRNPRTVPLVLVLGLSLSLLGALAARRHQVQNTYSRLAVEAAIAEEDLTFTFQAYRDILLGFRGHSTASLGLNRERFRQYFASLDLQAHHPGLLAVSYGVEIPGADRARVEQELRQEMRDPGFAIQPPGQRASYFVLLFAEPAEPNRASVGRDTRAIPGQGEAIDRARDTGALVLTGPTRVLQYPGPDPCVILRLPLFRGAPATTAERRQAFLGCINGVFRVQDLIAEAWGKDTLKKLEASVEDAGPAGQEGAAVPLYGGPLAAGGRGAERAVEVFGRIWRLHFRARPAFVGTQEWSLPLGIGLCGCLVTLLLWGFIWSLARTGRQARLLALRMMDQLRERESRMEAMSLAVPDPLAVLDREGRFLHIYGQHPAVLGSAPGELLGRTARETLPPEAADSLLAGIRTALDTHRLQTAGFDLATAEGERVFEGRLLPMDQEIEDRPCVVLSIRDITERTRAEETTRTKQKLESLGLLAGGIAHDFNNFLTAILGHVNLAQDLTGPESKAAPMLKRAEASVLRAAELAHQMLAYSGRGTLKVDLLDLNGVVAEMTELLAITITRQATLDIRLQPGLPPIMADAVQIQQVVMNLVTNASDALADSAGSITLETRAQEAGRPHLEAAYPGQDLAPGRYVLLRVTDTGCGMDPETQKRIFDPFFTTKATGRGLGLSALLGILKGHGAGIRILSAPGAGSRFEILFPVAGTWTPGTR